MSDVLTAATGTWVLDPAHTRLGFSVRHAMVTTVRGQFGTFEGTLVLVSHDRHLLRATTDQFLIVSDARLSPFDGDLDDYRDWLFKTKLAPEEQPAPLPEKKMAPSPDARAQKRREAEERQRNSAARKPLESRLKRLEEQMAKLAAKKAAIDSQLADPAIYAGEKKETLKGLILDQAYAARELESIEAEWLDLQRQLEALAT